MAERLVGGGRFSSWGQSSSRRVVGLVLALALASAPPGLAFAQGGKPAKEKPAAAAGAKTASVADKKKAGEHFKKGKELFDKKEYKGAKDEFDRAEEIIPASTAEFYIARCSEQLGDAADAVSWYDKAIGSGKLKPELEADAKARSSALKAKPTKIKVSSDPAGAVIMLDGKDTGQKTPTEIDATPGAHKLTLKAAGKMSVVQDVDVVAFAGATVNAKLENDDGMPAAAEDPFANSDKMPIATTKTSAAAPAAPAATTTDTTDTTVALGPTTTKRDNTWVYVTGVGAIVAVGVGAVFGVKALHDKKNFDDNCPSSGSAASCRSSRDTGTRDALIADMGIGIGITLAITSAVLYLSAPSTSESASAPTSKMAFAPIVSGVTKSGAPSMAGAAATFQF